MPHRLVYLNMEFSVLFHGCFGTFARWVQPVENESSHRGEVMDLGNGSPYLHPVLILLLFRLRRDEQAVSHFHCCVFPP